MFVVSKKVSIFAVEIGFHLQPQETKHFINITHCKISDYDNQTINNSVPNSVENLYSSWHSGDVRQRFSITLRSRTFSNEPPKVVTKDSDWVKELLDGMNIEDMCKNLAYPHGEMQ